MKKTFLILCVSILSVSVARQGSGFFDELLKPPPQKRQPEQNQTQKSQQQNPGFLEGLSGMFGAEKKDIDLLKKGLGVVQALQPIGFGGEYQNESLTRYINLVGKTIGEVSDRPNLAYHFAILNSHEQNAFAAPGGYIFVTIGLLRTLKNEAELAGVLAHEVAHVTQRHMLSNIRRGAILANVSEFTLSAMNKNPEMFSNVIDEITDKLFTKGLDKDLEYEADVYGIEFAYRAGYNPSGLEAYLKTLRSQEGHAQSRFFSTHPSTGVRLGKVQEKLRDYSDGSDLPFITGRFQRHMRSA